MEKLTRNQRMIVEFEAGHSVDELSASYEISRPQVYVVLQQERNKRLVSPLSYYRKFRDRQRNASLAIAT